MCVCCLCVGGCVVLLFESWVGTTADRLLKMLPLVCVLVVQGAPAHCVQSDMGYVNLAFLHAVLRCTSFAEQKQNSISVFLCCCVSRANNAMPKEIEMS